MVEFITMAPTSGDGEYIGVVEEEQQADGWTGVSIEAGRKATPEYIKAVAKAAEEGGFSTLLLPVGANCLDALVVAGQLLAETESLHILFAVRPGSVSPTLFAKQFATLDQWSNGRVHFNIVTGGNPQELEGEGDSLDHASRYRRTEEFIQIINQLFSGDKFDYSGEFYQLKDAQLLILPTTTPKVFFGGSSLTGKQVAAQLADVYMLWGETLENTKQQLDEIKTLVQQANRTVEYSISFQVVLGETEQQAWENAEKLISKADEQAAQQKETLQQNGEAVGVSRLHELMTNSKDSHYKIGPNLWAGLTKYLSGNSIALVGTPDQVAERLIEFIQLGFDKVLLRGFPHLETAEQVGALVIPRVNALLAKL